MAINVKAYEAFLSLPDLEGNINSQSFSITPEFWPSQVFLARGTSVDKFLFIAGDSTEGLQIEIYKALVTGTGNQQVFTPDVLLATVSHPEGDPSPFQEFDLGSQDSSGGIWRKWLLDTPLTLISGAYYMVVFKTTLTTQTPKVFWSLNYRQSTFPTITASIDAGFNWSNDNIETTTAGNMQAGAICFGYIGNQVDSSTSIDSGSVTIGGLVSSRRGYPVFLYVENEDALSTTVSINFSQIPPSNPINGTSEETDQSMMKWYYFEEGTLPVSGEFEPVLFKTNAQPKLGIASDFVFFIQPDRISPLADVYLPEGDVNLYADPIGIVPIYESSKKFIKWTGTSTPITDEDVNSESASDSTDRFSTDFWAHLRNKTLKNTGTRVSSSSQNPSYFDFSTENPSKDIELIKSIELDNTSDLTGGENEADLVRGFNKVIYFKDKYIAFTKKSLSAITIVPDADATTGGTFNSPFITSPGQITAYVSDRNLISWQRKKITILDSVPTTLNNVDSQGVYIYAVNDVMSVPIQGVETIFFLFKSVYHINDIAGASTTEAGFDVGYYQGDFSEDYINIQLISQEKVDVVPLPSNSDFSMGIDNIYNIICTTTVFDSTTVDDESLSRFILPNNSEYLYFTANGYNEFSNFGLGIWRIGLNDVISSNYVAEILDINNNGITYTGISSPLADNRISFVLYDGNTTYLGVRGGLDFSGAVIESGYFAMVYRTDDFITFEQLIGGFIDFTDTSSQLPSWLNGFHVKSDFYNTGATTYPDNPAVSVINNDVKFMHKVGNILHIWTCPSYFTEQNTPMHIAINTITKEIKVLRKFPIENAGDSNYSSSPKISDLETFTHGKNLRWIEGGSVNGNNIYIYGAEYLESSIEPISSANPTGDYTVHSSFPTNYITRWIVYDDRTINQAFDLYNDSSTFQGTGGFSDPVFVGSGVDDFSVSGTYPAPPTGTFAEDYIVKITKQGLNPVFTAGTSGIGDGSSGNDIAVEISGLPTSQVDGIEIEIDNVGINNDPEWLFDIFSGTLNDISFSGSPTKLYNYIVDVETKGLSGIVFSGTTSQLNDLIVVSVPPETYNIVIKITSSTPNKFQYSIDGGSTFNGLDISVSTISTPLGATGVSIKWKSNSGHILNNTWTFKTGLTASVVDSLLLPVTQKYIKTKIEKDGIPALDAGSSSGLLVQSNPLAPCVDFFEYEIEIDGEAPNLQFYGIGLNDLISLNVTSATKGYYYNVEIDDLAYNKTFISAITPSQSGDDANPFGDSLQGYLYKAEIDRKAMTVDSDGVSGLDDFTLVYEITFNGTGTNNLSISGTPEDIYDFVIEVVNIGVNPDEYQYSIDGGATFNGVIQMSTSFTQLGTTGVYVKWTNANTGHVVNDKWAFQSGGNNSANYKVEIDSLGLNPTFTAGSGAGTGIAGNDLSLSAAYPPSQNFNYEVEIDGVIPAIPASITPVQNSTILDITKSGDIPNTLPAKSFRVEIDGLAMATGFRQLYYRCNTNLNPTAVDFEVLDISNVKNIKRIGSISSISGSPSIVKVFGKYAYLLSQSEYKIWIIDISDSENPFVINSFYVDEQPFFFDVIDSYLYISCNTPSNNLKIFDVSNPNNPLERGSLNFGSGATSYGIIAEKLIYGSQEYTIVVVTSLYSELTTYIDATDPDDPFILNTSVDISEQLGSGACLNSTILKHPNGKTYSFTSGLDLGIIFIADITNPNDIKNNGWITSSHGLGYRPSYMKSEVRGSNAYLFVVTDNTYTNEKTLQIFDITNIQPATDILGYGLGFGYGTGANWFDVFGFNGTTFGFGADTFETTYAYAYGFGYGWEYGFNSGFDHPGNFSSSISLVANINSTIGTTSNSLEVSNGRIYFSNIYGLYIYDARNIDRPELVGYITGSADGDFNKSSAFLNFIPDQDDDASIFITKKRVGNISYVGNGRNNLSVSLSSNNPKSNKYVIKITDGTGSPDKLQYSLNGGVTFNGVDISLSNSYTIPSSGGVVLNWTGTLPLDGHNTTDKWVFEVGPNGLFNYRIEIDSTWTDTLAYSGTGLDDMALHGTPTDNGEFVVWIDNQSDSYGYGYGFGLGSDYFDVFGIPLSEIGYGYDNFETSYGYGYAFDYGYGFGYEYGGSYGYSSPIVYNENDTFSWKKDGIVMGAGIPITKELQELSDDVFIKFSSDGEKNIKSLHFATRMDSASNYIPRNNHTESIDVTKFYDINRSDYDSMDYISNSEYFEIGQISIDDDIMYCGDFSFRRVHAFDVSNPLKPKYIRDYLTGFVVTNATNANPIEITTAIDHTFEDGNYVVIEGVEGNTAANGTFYVNSTASNKFELYTNSSLTTGVAGNGAYTNGGVAIYQTLYITGVTQTMPIVVTTSVNHGLTTGDSVKISQVLFSSSANGDWTITVTGSNTFELDTSDGTLDDAYYGGGLVVSQNDSTTSTAIFSINARNGGLYVTHPSLRSFQVIDVSDPRNPIYIDNILVPNPATSLPVSCVSDDSYLYINNFDSTTLEKLLIYDISTPTSPVFVGSETVSVSLDLAIRNDEKNSNYIYTCGQFISGFYRIFDVSNPASPSFVGLTTITLSVTHFLKDIQFCNNFAYTLERLYYVYDFNTYEKHVLRIYSDANTTSPTLLNELILDDLLPIGTGMPISSIKVVYDDGLAYVKYGPAIYTISIADHTDIAIVDSTKEIYSFNIINATNAATIVVTTEEAHGLGVGHIVTIVNVDGNTRTNGEYYVFPYDNYNFALFTDPSFTSPVAGNGDYTSGGIGTSRRSPSNLEYNSKIQQGHNVGDSWTFNSRDTFRWTDDAENEIIIWNEEGVEINTSGSSFEHDINNLISVVFDIYSAGYSIGDAWLFTTEDTIRWTQKNNGSIIIFPESEFVRVPLGSASATTPIIVSNSAVYDRHEFEDGQIVSVYGDNGQPQINDVWELNVLDSDSFELVGSVGGPSPSTKGIVSWWIQEGIPIPSEGGTIDLEVDSLDNDIRIHFGDSEGHSLWQYLEWHYTTAVPEPPNTFKYKINGSLINSTITITGLPQNIGNTISATFDNTTGHKVGDKWIFTTVDTIRWTDDGENSNPFWNETNIPIIGDLLTLYAINNNIDIKFNSWYGHNLGDFWKFSTVDTLKISLSTDGTTFTTAGEKILIPFSGGIVYIGENSSISNVNGVNNITDNENSVFIDVDNATGHNVGDTWIFSTTDTFKYTTIGFGYGYGYGFGLGADYFDIFGTNDGHYGYGYGFFEGNYSFDYGYGLGYEYGFGSYGVGSGLSITRVPMRISNTIFDNITLAYSELEGHTVGDIWVFQSADTFRYEIDGISHGSFIPLQSDWISVENGIEIKFNISGIDSYALGNKWNFRTFDTFSWYDSPNGTSYTLQGYNIPVPSGVYGIGYGVGLQFGSRLANAANTEWIFKILDEIAYTAIAAGGTNPSAGNSSTNISTPIVLAITGASQTLGSTLDLGAINATFANKNGHNLGDKWIFNTIDTFKWKAASPVIAGATGVPVSTMSNKTTLTGGASVKVGFTNQLGHIKESGILDGDLWLFDMLSEFKLSTDGGSNFGSAVAISNTQLSSFNSGLILPTGISLSFDFNNLTGHILNDYWTFIPIPSIGYYLIDGKGVYHGKTIAKYSHDELSDMFTDYPALSPDMGSVALKPRVGIYCGAVVGATSETDNIRGNPNNLEPKLISSNGISYIINDNLDNGIRAFKTYGIKELPENWGRSLRDINNFETSLTATGATAFVRANLDNPNYELAIGGPDTFINIARRVEPSKVNGVVFLGEMKFDSTDPGFDNVDAAFPDRTILAIVNGLSRPQHISMFYQMNYIGTDPLTTSSDIALLGDTETSNTMITIKGAQTLEKLFTEPALKLEIPLAQVVTSDDSTRSLIRHIFSTDLESNFFRVESSNLLSSSGPVEKVDLRLKAVKLGDVSLSGPDEDTSNKKVSITGIVDEGSGIPENAISNGVTLPPNGEIIVDFAQPIYISELTFDVEYFGFDVSGANQSQFAIYVLSKFQKETFGENIVDESDWILLGSPAQVGLVSNQDTITKDAIGMYIKAFRIVLNSNVSLKIKNLSIKSFVGTTNEFVTNGDVSSPEMIVIDDAIGLLTQNISNRASSFATMNENGSYIELDLGENVPVTRISMNTYSAGSPTRALSVEIWDGVTVDGFLNPEYENVYTNTVKDYEYSIVNWNPRLKDKSREVRLNFMENDDLDGDQGISDELKQFNKPTNSNLLANSGLTTFAFRPNIYKDASLTITGSKSTPSEEYQGSIFVNCQMDEDGPFAADIGGDILGLVEKSLNIDFALRQVRKVRITLNNQSGSDTDVRINGFKLFSPIVGEDGVAEFPRSGVIWTIRLTASVLSQ